MKETIEELSQIVADFASTFNNMSDDEFSAKPLPNKWSKKEVLGHLIDSAQNNLRRFIVGQYEHLPKIVYEQDFWVSENGYQRMHKNDVIKLWQLVNHQMMNVLAGVSPANRSRQCDTGKGSQELHSIEWLAQDYVKHMKHHINQIVANSFDVVYV